MPIFNKTSPLSLYVHFPWCISKCPYCDFNSHKAPPIIPETVYIDTLLHDLSAHQDYLINKQFKSVFLGGGTPSLFSNASIKKLIDELFTSDYINPHTEITLEANPGTFEQAKFEDFLNAGINRLSLGVQSFQNVHLKKLGRIHSSDQAKAAIMKAKALGFANFNIDLMFGLPEQTKTEAINDLEVALQLNPPHLSWYQLTLEPNTIFYKNPPPLPNEDDIWDIQIAGQKILTEHGYDNYEVSAYCKDQSYCQHNLNYWEFGDYLGIGAGAHSKITLSDSIVRFQKSRMPKEYLLNKGKVINQKELLQDDLIFEFMLNSLRLFKEISFEHFESYTRIPREHLIPYLVKAENKRLLTFNEHFFKPTDLGYKHLNTLTQIFLNF